MLVGSCSIARRWCHDTGRLSQGPSLTSQDTDLRTVRLAAVRGIRAVTRSTRDYVVDAMARQIEEIRNLPEVGR